MAVLAVLAVLIAHIWSMHARKWLIVRETANTAKTAMRIFAVVYRICPERKHGRRNTAENRTPAALKQLG